MYIDLETIKDAATLITALTVIGGVLIAGYNFYLRQKKQDEELAAIRSELQILCFAVKACLSGLKEQGCNGPVTQALDVLEKHLNKLAHQVGANE